MAFIKENNGGSIVLPTACCSIPGCPSCDTNKPGSASNLYTQTANRKEKQVGAGGGAS